jgi:branched-chain amino acid transport system ATP-binding protein
VLVLVQGELLVSGSPDEVRGDPRVVEAYLGAPPEEVEARLHDLGVEGGETHGEPHGEPAGSHAKHAKKDGVS